MQNINVTILLNIIGGRKTHSKNIVKRLEELEIRGEIGKTRLKGLLNSASGSETSAIEYLGDILLFYL